MKAFVVCSWTGIVWSHSKVHFICIRFQFSHGIFSTQIYSGLIRTMSPKQYETGYVFEKWTFSYSIFTQFLRKRSGCSTASSNLQWEMFGRCRNVCFPICPYAQCTILMKSLFWNSFLVSFCIISRNLQVFIGTIHWNIAH